MTEDNAKRAIQLADMKEMGEMISKDVDPDTIMRQLGDRQNYGMFSRWFGKTGEEAKTVEERVGRPAKLTRRSGAELKKWALAELKAADDDGDAESSHGWADSVLCDLLNELGYEDVVVAYEKIDKWYA